MEETKTYEAIEYLIVKNNIEDIPISIFTKLLDLNEGEKYENYTLKDHFTNSGIVFETRENKNTKKQIKLVECVTKYYDINHKNTDICYDIVEKIGLTYPDIKNCTTCHKKCLELAKNKQLKRKNN